MEAKYAAVRYYRHKNQQLVLKNNLTVEQAREFCEDSPTKRSRQKSSLFGEFNSFVGFTHMSNL